MTAILLLLTLLTGCTADSSTDATASPTMTPPATVTPDPEIAAIRQLWRDSAHAHTYAEEKGPNTYCARCHSPENWDPAATIGSPPNCVSCKFPFEEEMRVAPSNPPVAEASWRNIGCEICHAENDGTVNASISWLNTSTDYRESVADSSELCGHCHRDTDTLRHKRQLGTEAHTDFVCTDCHDPHSTDASCLAAGCHENKPVPLPTPLPEHRDQIDTTRCEECHTSVEERHMTVTDVPPTACFECHGYLFVDGGSSRLKQGHGSVHVDVACVACHDASGLEVGPIEGKGQWKTFRTTELLGRSSREPYQSHNLQREVACDRCHYADNPWGLVAEVGGDS